MRGLRHCCVDRTNQQRTEIPSCCILNARLTPIARLELERQIEAGWPQAEVACQFRVSRASAAKWWRRYLAEGEAGLADRNSAPRRCRRRTARRLQRIICALRLAENLGPHGIGWRLGIPRSTVYAVLKRAGLNRLSWVNRITRQPVRRYEHPSPGDMLHLDVKKLGRVPDGGGKLCARLC